MRTKSSHNSVGSKEVQSERLGTEFRRWRKINIWIDRVLLTILIFLTVFVGSGLIGGLQSLSEGIGSVKYHSFGELMQINPDTIAWLSMDGTHINHPVVRSSDNFDYLDKGFDGRYYEGGTLFLDKDNKSFEDGYCMIHGHHMAAGAMFGDLEKYLDAKFFEENRTGTLLTADYDYDITVFATGIFDAYDSHIYNVGGKLPLDYVKENVANFRCAEMPDHVLALSTCYDDMTDNRIVVFCALTDRRPHR